MVCIETLLQVHSNPAFHYDTPGATSLKLTWNNITVTYSGTHAPVQAPPCSTQFVVKVRMSLSFVAFGFITDGGHGAYWKLSMKNRIERPKLLLHRLTTIIPAANVYWHRQCLLMLVQVTLCLLPHLWTSRQAAT